MYGRRHILPSCQHCHELGDILFGTMGNAPLRACCPVGSPAFIRPLVSERPRREGLPSLPGLNAEQSYLARTTGEPGFEPGLTDPESVVLPLHYSPTILASLSHRHFSENTVYIISSPTSNKIPGISRVRLLAWSWASWSRKIRGRSRLRRASCLPRPKDGRSACRFGYRERTVSPLGAT